jgi:hypothetical protein
MHPWTGNYRYRLKWNTWEEPPSLINHCNKKAARTWKAQWLAGVFAALK